MQKSGAFADREGAAPAQAARQSEPCSLSWRLKEQTLWLENKKGTSARFWHGQSEKKGGQARRAKRSLSSKKL